MEQTELKEILDQHQLWLAAKGGSRADLRGANLTNANLTNAYLHGANLSGANLSGANLEDADLTNTILDKKAEKQPEVASVKSENLRSEFEALAKKHGLQITCLEFKMI